MAEIVFDYVGVKGTLDELKDAYKKMDNCSDDISRISRNLNGYMNASVITTLNNAADNNEEIAKKIKKLREALKDILEEYKRTEKAICKEDIDRSKITDPAKTDTAGEQVLDYIWEALKQAVLGDITDDGNLLGIALSVGVGLIPYVGQIADVRDLIADIVHLCTDGATGEEWVALGFTVIGIIPGIGDFLKHGDDVAKGIAKLVKNADKADEIADAVKAAMKKGDDLFQELSEAAKKEIDSDKLLKTYKEIRERIINKGEDLPKPKDFKEFVDKFIKEYPSKFREKLVTEFEKYVTNEAVESGQSGHNTYVQYATQ